MKKLMQAVSVLLLATGQVLAQDYDALIRQSLQQRDNGDLAGAEQTLRQAYVIPPDKSEVAYLLAMVMAFQQRYADALDMLDAALRDYPDNVDLQLGRARVLSYQGVYQEALKTVDAVLMWNPDNTEALNLAGRIALYQRRPAAAVEHYNAVLALDAGNLEALVGLYDAHTNLGDNDVAAPFLQRAASVAPNHIDVKTRQNPQQFNAEPRHQLTTGFSRSTIDLAAFADWSDRFVEYRHLQPNGNQQYVRVEHDHRFDRHDTLYEVGASFQQQSQLPFELAFGFTPSDDFLPEYYGRIGARTRLTDGTGNYGTVILTGMFQYSSFANGDTRRAQLGLEYYLPGVDAWLTPAIGMVRDQFGKDTFAWGIGAHWQVTGPTRIGVSYSDAPETENLITTDSTAYGFYLRQDLGNRFVLFLNFNRFDRVASYVRKSYDATLQYRF